jgi:hypothetical protein
MAKVIDFYVRDLTPRKVRWVPRAQRGKVIEFPKEKSANRLKTDQVRDLYESVPVVVSRPGCFSPTA